MKFFLSFETVVLSILLMSVGAACDDKSLGKPFLDAGPIDGSVTDAVTTDADPPRPLPDDTVCSEDGWCWSHPVPTGKTLYSVWVGPDDEVVVAGDAGSVLIDEGEGFTVMNCGLDGAGIWDLWGPSLEELVAVGDGVFRYDGECWHPVETGLELAILSGIWGASTDDIFVVGDHLVAHFDGQQWLPLDPAPPFFVLDVWGSGPQDVHAGGMDLLYGEPMPVLHYDGQQWSLDFGGPISVEGIWGSAADDIYFTGTGGVYHYDGQSWSRENDLQEALFDIWGLGSDDIYFVGEVALHFDGMEWTQEQTFDTFAMGLRGNENLGPVAVGMEGLISFRDGNQWQRVDTRLTMEALSGVWGSSMENVYAVGTRGAIMHFDGEKWSLMDSGVDWDIMAIWGFGPEDIYAVGWESEILHFNGQQWQSTSVTQWTNRWASALWGTSPDNIYAGVENMLFHFDGNDWTEVASVADQSIRGIWGPGPDLVYAVGANSEVLRLKDGAWETLQPPITQQLYAITGSSASNIYVAAGDGLLLHFDGLEWSTAVHEPNVTMFRSCWMSGPDDVWVGGGGFVYHYDGSQWSRSELPGRVVIRSMWGHGRGHLFGVAGEAAILRHFPTP